MHVDSYPPNYQILLHANPCKFNAHGALNTTANLSQVIIWRIPDYVLTEDMVEQKCSEFANKQFNTPGAV